MAVGAMPALMVMATAPTLACTAVGGDMSLRFVDCSQVQAATPTQINAGDATSDARDPGSAADASIDQSLTIEQSQVNAPSGAVPQRVAT